MLTPEPSEYPLSSFFLGGYLSKNTRDAQNFPTDEFPAWFERYERLFESALRLLHMSKESLKSKSEFNFDSGNAANLEGGIAVLRLLEALRIKDFSNISLVKPKKECKGADVTAEKNSHKVCFETKAITKQSRGREGLFFEDQLYEKILETISTTATQLQCAVKVLVYVVNWFSQSIYLDQDSYQSIVNRLEEQQLLVGIDGVWFILSAGHEFVFLNEGGKSIDVL